MSNTGMHVASKGKFWQAWVEAEVHIHAANLLDWQQTRVRDPLMLDIEVENYTKRKKKRVALVWCKKQNIGYDKRRVLVSWRKLDNFKPWQGFLNPQIIGISVKRKTSFIARKLFSDFFEQNPELLFRLVYQIFAKSDPIQEIFWCRGG